MADRKQWKVYDGSGMIAATAYAEDAAALVGMGGERTVKRAGRIVFRGPVDEESGVDASDSWDGAAEVMVARWRQHQQERYRRVFPNEEE